MYESYTDKLLVSVRSFFERRKKGSVRIDIYNKALIKYEVFLPDLSKLSRSLQNKEISIWIVFYRTIVSWIRNSSMLSQLK